MCVCLSNYTNAFKLDIPLLQEAENTTMVGVDLPLDRPHHVLLTMIRDQELVIPEKKPPEPVLQEPYYLGLLERKRRECDPPVIPTPPPRESRYLQIHSLLQGQNVAPSEDERRPIKERYENVLSLCVCVCVCVCVFVCV